MRAASAGPKVWLTVQADLRWTRSYRRMPCEKVPLSHLMHTQTSSGALLDCLWRPPLKINDPTKMFFLSLEE